MEQVKNIRIGRVLNNQDPLLLGRLRVYAPDGDPREYLEIPKSEWWTSKDPLIHIPLIPYHLHITPSEDEYVHLIYSTDREPYDSNKFSKSDLRFSNLNLFYCLTDYFLLHSRTNQSPVEEFKRYIQRVTSSFVKRK